METKHVQFYHWADQYNVTIKEHESYEGQVFELIAYPSNLSQLLTRSVKRGAFPSTAVEEWTRVLIETAQVGVRLEGWKVQAWDPTANKDLVTATIAKADHTVPF